MGVIATSRQPFRNFLSVRESATRCDIAMPNNFEFNFSAYGTLEAAREGFALSVEDN